jgi:excisionase family DNA binding protein
MPRKAIATNATRSNKDVTVMLNETTSAQGRLMDAGEVAELLGLPKSWVYSQTRANLIPAVKLGRYYRYRVEAIRSWIETREVEAIG